MKAEINFERVYRAFQTAAVICPASAPEFEIGSLGIIDGSNEGIVCNLCEDLKFREGELTIWAGASGSGKSLITGQVVLNLLNVTKVCVMSLEMLPARTLVRMARQSLKKYPTQEEMSSFLHRAGQRLFLLDHVGSCGTDLILGACISAARDHGCTHIFIDNLMKVCRENGDGAMDEQRKFVSALCALAKELSCHIHLVCHIRKQEKEGDDVDKYSIRGSSSITDQADNIVMVQRNISKQNHIDKNGYDYSYDEKYPDTTLKLVKQRNGDIQNRRVELWYCPVTMRVGRSINDRVRRH